MVIVVVSVEGEKGKEDARATLLSIANPLKSVEFCQGIFITTWWCCLFQPVWVVSPHDSRCRNWGPPPAPHSPQAIKGSCKFAEGQKTYYKVLHALLLPIKTLYHSNFCFPGSYNFIFPSVLFWHQVRSVMNRNSASIYDWVNCVLWPTWTWLGELHFMPTWTWLGELCFLCPTWHLWLTDRKSGFYLWFHELCFMLSMTFVVDWH